MIYPAAGQAWEIKHPPDTNTGSWSDPGALKCRYPISCKVLDIVPEPAIVHGDPSLNKRR